MKGLGRYISIHPPRAGWDAIVGYFNDPGGNFNPPTPCGVGRMIKEYYYDSRVFQSTHPVRGGTSTTDPDCGLFVFQSTHPVRGGTGCDQRHGIHADISIHPPRAGWDGKSVQNIFCTLCAFNKSVRFFIGTIPFQAGILAAFQKKQPYSGANLPGILCALDIRTK